MMKTKTDTVAALADRIVQDVAELPDRTSPDDWPEAMLVTADELRQIVLAALSDAPVPPTCEACEAGYRLADTGVHYDDARGGWTWGVCRKVVARIRSDAPVPPPASGIVTNESGTWCPYCRRDKPAEPCARCGLSRATLAHMTAGGVPVHPQGHIFESLAIALPPATEEETAMLVNGYDAQFWHDSYNMLRDAITANLDDYIHDDDVAEEAILVEAIETAGKRLKALAAPVPALREQEIRAKAE